GLQKVKFDKYSNSNRSASVAELLKEYCRVCQLAVDRHWTDIQNIPTYVPRDLYDYLKSQTNLPTAFVQICSIKASGIVKGTVNKHKKRLYVLSTLTEGTDEQD